MSSRRRGRSRHRRQSAAVQLRGTRTCRHSQEVQLVEISREAGTLVGVVRETNEGERRVALVPKVVAALTSKGVRVVVEAGAGLGALIPDQLYVDAGASIGDPYGADVVVKVAPPSSAEVRKLRRGSTLIGFLAPRNADTIIPELTAAGVQAFAVEAIPRISRAQVMDALSSQANVAGYKAVLLAASESTRFFPMLTTAAGTVKPATVLVLGVGVAGLQALATAKRLGGRATGYDVRPEVADQVRSVGAQWLDLGIDAAGEGGYARELTEDERAQQQAALEKAISTFDVVITTALVPGRPAPKLVTAAAAAGMRPGSVVVDLAGETGGNCELTEPGRTVVKNDVIIASPLNLPATMPEHASELYSKNISALIELMLDDAGALAPDFTDEVLAKSCVTRTADTTVKADA
ncbi:NAD(P) transhydrogenase subunit alpha [Rhodococcus sp. BP-349]|nr:NAD(P) transhydrogenase subunit alpha [Rhodococcus sp. BP-363]MBY6543480.1 NAD(P) transhydrogenase subunit alpha [Rhodococcus sp. BP-369]MBY6562710.1 NAD(P) transhydrogenase subunit alpha [Rhodococcus sp. BP-370]MBY6577002.1 NAD(P) transhydrogenase subunit alpha [Rhodococcus sp. BP-364]MBY6586303.1 NAD(P) transhydrogenase subunit alpha [Rhodococcus sp. BP-358]MBY6590640.1 NAD(P) transhydrogenase subunit alpha [Rhodococcus sp. BP-362]MBY6596026.1 NAD(P) transhydrogenase subunit alpha [Rhodo